MQARSGSKCEAHFEKNVHEHLDRQSVKRIRSAAKRRVGRVGPIKKNNEVTVRRKARVEKRDSRYLELGAVF